MDLAELLQALNEHAEQGEEQRDEVVSGLTKEVPSVHQVIFNAGYVRSKEKAERDTVKLQEELEAAQAKATELQEQLDAADGGDEKVEQLRTQVAHWKGEAERLSGELETKEQEHAKALREGTLDTKVAEFQGRLAKRVHPKYAERVGRDPTVKSRLRVAEDGSLELLQPGKDIPVTVPEGKDPVDLLVEEVVRDTPSELILADGDRGSGVNDKGGGPGGKGIGARFLEETQERLGKRPNPLKPESTGAGT